MTAYISISFSNRAVFNEVLTTISNILLESGIQPFIFVDEYQFSPAQEQQLMKQAMADIANCTFLIAETSDKAIGIGVEVGYAKAKGKPVIYLRHTDAEHSTTVAGISDFKIIYKDNTDLQKQLRDVIRRIQEGLL
jgi:2'-deoxynucleoside 5'-phosphate N-hydrolase